MAIVELKKIPSNAISESESAALIATDVSL